MWLKVCRPTVVVAGRTCDTRSLPGAILVHATRARDTIGAAWHVLISAGVAVSAAASASPAGIVPSFRTSVTSRPALHCPLPRRAGGCTRKTMVVQIPEVACKSTRSPWLNFDVRTIVRHICVALFVQPRPARIGPSAVCAAPLTWGVSATVVRAGLRHAWWASSFGTNLPRT